ncbi:protoporphyrinogen/coproporphyrinogen oxidase [Actinomadura harenae]|uniref:FAD-binding protein n=1 Tax=Actinomadura harenae TaxID=2483351 RepID=A0A3M2M021_9ACTN|nr:NAD(P)-binding protein [Actinomadura harenae]RMI42826.1 hypothetical protein EBO15_18500 [Actinomadura harenae]
MPASRRNGRDTSGDDTGGGDAVEFLILGSGMAGLGAGVAARRHGRDSLILEAGDEPGGLCRSVEVLGCEFDYGPKIVIEQDAENCKDLLGFLEDNHEAYPMAESAYLSEYGLVGFPLQRHLVDLPEAERDRIIADLEAQRATPRRVESYADWLVNGYGRYFCEKVLFPYEEKKWQIPLADMDYQWALSRPVRVDMDEVYAGARTKLPPNRTYYYPREGSISTLTRRLVEHSGPIEVGREVTEVDPVGKYVVAGGRRYHYEHLISSIPLDRMVRITAGMEDAADPRGLLDWLGIRVFNLVFDGDRDLDGTAIYFPEREFVFRRVSVVGNLCPALDRPGRTPISVEISLDPSGGAPPADEQLDRVLRDLRKVPQFAALGDLLGHRVLEIEHAYPMQRNHMRAHVDDLHARFARFGIRACGRGGRFDYCNSDVAFEQGKRAVHDALAQARAHAQAPDPAPAFDPATPSARNQ